MSVLTALLFILVVQLSLKLLSFQQFRKFYSWLLQTDDSPNPSARNETEKIRAVQMAGNALKANCLPQALALKWFLRADASTEIIVGVDKSVEFQAHAWVQKADRILIGDQPTSHFQPLWTWK